MTPKQIESIFELAQVEVRSFHAVANQYERNSETPWWLVVTERGNFLVGWRHRVINIDFSDTVYRGNVTEDDVTKEETYVHAYGYAKAVEYISSIVRLPWGAHKFRTIANTREDINKFLSENPLELSPKSIESVHAIWGVYGITYNCDLYAMYEGTEYGIYFDVGTGYNTAFKLCKLTKEKFLSL